MGQYTLYEGDAFEVLSSVADSSVNLIVTSPPYADARKKTYGGVRIDQYVQWFLPLGQELHRVLTDDGSFVLNIKERVVDGERSTYVMELVMALRGAGWRWTEEYSWHKTTTAPGKWPNRFRDCWEHLFHFTKSKSFVMNQDAVKVPIGAWSKSRLKNLCETDMVRQKSAVGSGYAKNVSAWVGRESVYPSNVLHGPPEARNVGHPAAFPIWLPEWFITLFSHPGDTVLDPFMGSGSTAIAALNKDRNVIGCELMTSYAAAGVERVRRFHPTSSITVISAAPGTPRTALMDE